jgi:hypothetical protein
MAKRYRLNPEAVRLERFPEITVTMRDTHPLQTWLERMWAVISDPRTLVTVAIPLLTKACGS